MTVRDWKHCPRCAAPLTLDTSTDDVHVACAACGFEHYDNPLPTSVVVILRLSEHDQEEVLLVRRAHDPRRGHWDTVGGFVNLGETAEECARREVREELGLEFEHPLELGTFVSEYVPGRQTLATAYRVWVEGDEPIRLSDENLEYGWFPLATPPEPLAFPDGVDAIAAVRAHLYGNLFHVVRPGEYDPEAPEHRPPGFDAEGFVHLATMRQLEGVVERYYAGVEGLEALVLDAKVLADVRWERGAGDVPGPFPHLYGPVPAAAIRGTIEL